MAVNITLAQSPGADSVLIAVVALTDTGGAAQVLGISQVGASWFRAVQGGTGAERVEIWYSTDAEGADTAIVINTVADEDEVGFVEERFGVAAFQGTPVDQVATASGVDTPVDSGQTAVTTNEQELFIGAHVVRDVGSVNTPTNGFAIDDQVASGTVLGAILSKVVTATEQAQVETLHGGDPGSLYGGAIATFFGLLLQIDSVTPDIVPSNGGYEVTLGGKFDPEREYEVFMGPAGDDTDARAYQPSGKGVVAVPVSQTELKVYTPEMLAGSLRNLYVEESGITSQSDQLRDALAVIDPDYKTLSYQMRTQYPPNYRVGSRDYTTQPRVNTVKQLLQYSEDLTNGVWVPSLISAIPGQDDPFGGSLAHILHEDSSIGAHHLTQSGFSVVGGSTYSESFYFKADSRDWAFIYIAASPGVPLFWGYAWFDLIGGVLGSVTSTVPMRSAIRDVGGGWYRCTLTARTLSTNTTATAQIGPAAADNNAGSFVGLDQDSIRVAFGHFDPWSVERAYVKTEADPIT